MIKRHKSLCHDFTKEQNEDFFVANWVWHSHNWEEKSPGYCECLWCGRQHTNKFPVRSNDNLCPKNPAVIKMKDEIREGNCDCNIVGMA